MVIKLNKELALMILLLLLVIIPIAVNVAITLPLIPYVNYSSMLVTSNIGILGGEEEMETPFAPG